MKKAIVLKVEILAGTHIEEAIKEAKKLAEKLEVGIEFDFNGVSMVVYSWSDIEKKIEEYHSELKRREEERKGKWLKRIKNTEN